MTRLIVVVGFMGCGKTEVAKRLAILLDLPFVDLDDLITHTEGQSPAQLIRECGEQTFRTIETRVLADLIERGEDRVVALGGGAWIENSNRQLINHVGAVTIWLDTPFEVCWKRISTSNDDRPLGATREEAETRFYERLPVYQLADIVIDVADETDPEALALRIQRDLSN